MIKDHKVVRAHKEGHIMEMDLASEVEDKAGDQVCKVKVEEAWPVDKDLIRRVNI